MKQFFPIGKGEALLLFYLIIMAIISFLPMWRTMEIGGMAVFGWLMVTLMITSPILALLVFLRSDRGNKRKIRSDSGSIKNTKNESHSFDSAS